MEEKNKKLYLENSSITLRKMHKRKARKHRDVKSFSTLTNTFEENFEHSCMNKKISTRDEREKMVAGSGVAKGRSVIFHFQGKTMYIFAKTTVTSREF